MIVQKQLNRHKPAEGIYGDCHRTAFACLFDLRPDEVPHFGDGNVSSEEFNRRSDEWLNSKGYSSFTIAFPGELQDVLHVMKFLNPGIYYVLGGVSRSGSNHSVVCCEDQIVCDPSLNDSGIVGPCTDGHFWVTVFVAERFVRPA